MQIVPEVQYLGERVSAPRKVSRVLISSRTLKSTQYKVSRVPTLCEPMDRSPPGSSVHGILQARIVEWVAISFSRGSSDSGIEHRICITSRLFTAEPPVKVEALFVRICKTQMA